MGILDEAIRQHLDLKRRQGAAEDEIARLEGEAFGPPSRPGEPDFPTGEEPQLAEADAPTGEELGAEPAAPEAVQPAAETEALTAEPEAEPGSFYDRTAAEEDLELEDLDLELDDLDAAPAPGESAADAAPPIESLDTVEHPGPVEAQDTVEHDFERELSHDAEPEPGALAGDDDEEVVEGSVVDEEGSVEDEEGDDVLEETPEFLRDQPEDDELWFEQGEPKDFDF